GRTTTCPPGSVDDGGRSSPADPACEAAVSSVTARSRRGRSGGGPASAAGRPVQSGPATTAAPSDPRTSPRNNRGVAPAGGAGPEGSARTEGAARTQGSCGDGHVGTPLSSGGRGPSARPPDLRVCLLVPRPGRGCQRSRPGERHPTEDGTSRNRTPVVQGT